MKHYLLAHSNAIRTECRGRKAKLWVFALYGALLGVALVFGVLFFATGGQ